MLIIGDVHGMFMKYIEIIMESGCDYTIVAGDFGIGYGYDNNLIKIINKIPGKHKFIRGNHDSPKDCKKHPMHLGNWGSKGNMFWIAGAATPSIFGKDWFEEELSYKILCEVRAAYRKAKPKLVISHVAPLFAGEYAMKRKGEGSKTEQMMEAMWEEHKPEMWIFGHYHKSVDFQCKGTRFICLDALETIEVSDEYIS